MKITSESSAPYVAEIAGLSPGAQAYLYGDYNELKRLQAKPALQTQAMRQVKVNAAQVKDQSVLAAISLVLTTKRKTLMHEKGWRDRASFIQTQLTTRPTAYGLPDNYAHTARERDIRLIRAALHEWEKINGCYRKSVPLN